MRGTKIRVGGVVGECFGCARLLARDLPRQSQRLGKVPPMPIHTPDLAFVQTGERDCSNSHAVDVTQHPSSEDAPPDGRMG
jgi:hypothetical protein